MVENRIVKVQRIQTDGDAVHGILSVTGIDNDWFTIENRHSIIPQGEYIMEFQWSPKFRRYLWEIYGVKGRSEIKIHIGRHPQDSEGCILLKPIDLEELHQALNIREKYKLVIS